MNRNIYEYDQDIGYRFIPHLKSRINADGGGYLIKTNAQGFRNDDDFEQEKTRERILVFGDSFTAGDGVSNGKRYTDHLQNKLGHQVYNFGLSGSGTDQQYLIYQKFAKHLDCDAVVLTILVENIRRVNAKYRFYYDDANNMICYPKPYYDYQDGKLNLHHSPVPNKNYRYEELSDADKEKVDKGGKFMGARKLLIKMGMKQITQRLTKVQPFPEYNSSNNASWVLMKEIIKDWCMSMNKPVYIVPLPTYHYIEDLADSAAYQQRFMELQEEINAKVLDPLPFFKTFDKETRRNFRFEKDIHLTKLGHEKLGAYLTEQLTVNKKS